MSDFYNVHQIVYDIVNRSYQYKNSDTVHEATENSTKIIGQLDNETFRLINN